jgi:WD40 repeat protein
VASSFGYVEVFYATGQQPTLLQSLSALQSGGSYGLIEGVTFSPDSSEVAFSAGDGTAKIYDVASPQLITTVASLDSPVITFSPDGQDLATAGHDGAIEIWQAAPGAPLGPGRPHRNRQFGPVQPERRRSGGDR